MGETVGEGPAMGPESTCSWAEKWNHGKSAIHIGNVAEFNAQFPTAGPPRVSAASLPPGFSYACMAAFLSPSPAVIVLPGRVVDEWLPSLSAHLQWAGTELISGLSVSDSLEEGLQSHPELRRALSDRLLPILPWGLTLRFEELFRGRPSAALAATLRFESKAESHDLLTTAAADHADITLPQTWRVDSEAEAVGLLNSRIRDGRTSVLKTLYGFGGHGTVIVTPDRAASAGGAARLIRELIATGELELAHGLLVQEYVSGNKLFGDLTFDGFVDEEGNGSVYPVGTALMRMAGTHYEGATVGPAVIPGPLEASLHRYGVTVGRLLAEQGYRGWYNVDVVLGRNGRRLAPTEINLRTSGPAVAHMIRSRLDLLHTRSHVVRVLDSVELGSPHSQKELIREVSDLGKHLAGEGTTVFTTVPVRGADPRPTVGLAIAAQDLNSLDSAELFLRRHLSHPSRVTRTRISEEDGT